MDSVYGLPFCIKFAHNKFYGILLGVHRFKYLQHALSLLFDTATFDVDWSDIFAKTPRLAYLPKLLTAFIFDGRKKYVGNGDDRLL
jgi:hypothetical protein